MNVPVTVKNGDFEAAGSRAILSESETQKIKGTGADGRREHLRRLREIAGLSQYEVARLSGLTRNRISLFECGYVQLQDEEYSLAERAIRDVLMKKRERLGIALSNDETAVLP
jgi:hypothetical protein